MPDKRTFPKKLGLLVVGVWIGISVGIAILMIASGKDWIPLDLKSPIDFTQSSSMEKDVPAPDFELLSTDGELVSLTTYQGKVIVLNFWATWCGPCVQEIPMFQDYFERYNDQIVVLGINEQENPEEVREFLKEFGVSYPILLDRSAELAPVYRLMVLPVTVFIDEDGILRYHHIGFMSEDQFRSYLSKMGVVL